jgi:hypothetical protein
MKQTADGYHGPAVRKTLIGNGIAGTETTAENVTPPVFPRFQALYALFQCRLAVGELSIPRW